jgi:hypothetical protein
MKNTLLIIATASKVLFVLLVGLRIILNTLNKSIFITTANRKIERIIRLPTSPNLDSNEKDL